MTDAILLWNTLRSCSNKKHSCYLPQLTDNKVKDSCRLHGLKVALPQKVDTWSTTLMADDISPRRPSAASLSTLATVLFGNEYVEPATRHSFSYKDNLPCLLTHHFHSCCCVLIIAWPCTCFASPFVSKFKFNHIFTYLSYFIGKLENYSSQTETLSSACAQTKKGSLVFFFNIFFSDLVCAVIVWRMFVMSHKLR